MNTIDCSPIVFALAAWNRYVRVRGGHGYYEIVCQGAKAGQNQKGINPGGFWLVSSRTYLSTLERANKSLTLEKVKAIAGRMSVHPVTLMVMPATALA